MPTVYITLPNTGTGSINIPAALFGYSGINCLTASVANYCYGFATGSYATFFNGNVSGSVGNQAQSGSAQKNDCPPCETGSFYTTVVPANTYFSTTSLADANAQAIAYLNSVSQSNANTFGSCSFNYFYSTAISASIQKNDCGVNGTGSFVNVILPASYSFDSCSQANAQSVAQNYFNSISQSEANASGSCVYTSSVQVQFNAGVYYDAHTTSSYPLTMSALVQNNTSSVPNETSSQWVTIGYLQGTQNNDFATYLMGSSSFELNWTGSNPNYWLWTKIRGNASEKIKTNDYKRGVIFAPIDNNAKAAIMQIPMKITGSTPVTASLIGASFGSIGAIASKIKLYQGYNNFSASNGFTQSVLTSDEIILSIRPAGLSASVDRLFDGYFLVTSSATFPSYNDSKWKKYVELQAGTVYVSRWSSGSLSTLQGTGLDSWAITGSTANYYYFKMMTGSIAMNWTSLVDQISCSVATSFSGSNVMRLQVSQSQQSVSSYIQIDTKNP